MWVVQTAQNSENVNVICGNINSRFIHFARDKQLIYI